MMGGLDYFNILHLMSNQHLAKQSPGVLACTLLIPVTLRVLMKKGQTLMSKQTGTKKKSMTQSQDKRS